MAIVLFVLAACLFAAAEVQLTRANPGVRLSLWRKAPRTPSSVRVLWGFGGFSAVFAAINPSDHLAWWWGVALIVGASLPAVALRLLQNGREPAPQARS